MIIEVASVELDRPQREAQRLESIIGKENVDAFAVATAVQPDILRSWGVTRTPVFRIDGVTVWEGERPPGDVVRERLHWPTSLDEAVDRLLSTLKAIPDDPMAELEIGMAIRNSFGLWGANRALLRSCGSESMSTDDASAVILEKARQVSESRKRPK